MMLMHRFVLSSLGLAGLILGGCVGENPDYCDETKPCPSGYTCDPQTHGCVPAGDGGSDATADTLAPDPDGQAGDGAGGKDNGASCFKDGDCISGTCAEGVCCNDKCESTCKSCKVSGKEGTCSFATSGNDPKQDCAGTDTSCSGSCDGLGACLFPGSTTSCGTDACSGGKLTVHQCDGAGGCGATFQDCGGYACDSTGAACKTACTAKTDCTGTFTCIKKVCTNSLADGQPCGTNNDACKSKKCVDGICCATDCTGTCMACDVKSKEGTCSAIPSGQDPATECAGKDALCSGSCNGSGKCAFPGATKQCKTDACSGSTLTKHACDGAGTCGSSSSSCGAYMCNATKDGCRASCTSNTHCTGKLCDVYTAGATKKCPMAATVCYVDAKVTGGNGTLAKPYATINLCLATTKAYVSVADGTYNENLKLDAKKVQIVAVTEPGSVYGGAVPSVSVSSSSTAVELKNKSELYLQGLNLTTSDKNAALVYSFESTMTANRCRLHDTPASGSGIGILAGPSASTTLTDCAVSGCYIGFNASSGAKNVSFDRVRLENNRNAGFMMEGDASASFSMTQITAVKNGNDGIWVSGSNMFFDRVVAQFNGGSGMNLLGSTGVSVYNLLATNNATGVTWFGGSASGSTVTNATIAFNKNAEVACGTAPGVGKLVLVNSIIWNTSGTTYSGTGCSFSYCDVAGGATGTKNINLDPFFVDKAKGDYHLSNTISKKSPCINVGDPNVTTLPKTDLDGSNRTVGVVDLGAYEVK